MALDVALDIKNEIVLQGALKNQYICQLLDIKINKTATDSSVYMIMELAAGGDLFAKVEASSGFDESMARFYFRQLILGVAYCHARFIVHRDLKLENIMLEDTDGQKLKIIDFGFAKNVAPSHLRQWGFYKGEKLNCKAILGTSKYVSPEILDGEVRHCLYLVFPLSSWLKPCFSLRSCRSTTA